MTRTPQALSRLPALFGGDAYTRVATGILLAIVFLTPWRFGSVEARTQVWIAAGLLVVVTLLLLRPFRFDTQGSRLAGIPVSLWPLAISLLLGVVQLLPLPRSLYDLACPGGRELLADCLPSADDQMSPLRQFHGVSAGLPNQVSVCPSATRRDLSALATAGVLLAVSAILFRRSATHELLFWGMAINGAAISLVGLLRLLQPTWFGVAMPDGAPFAFFVNRNNAAGYLNMCLAGSMGLVAHLLREQAGGRSSRAYQTDLLTFIGSRLKQLEPRLVTALGLATFTVCGVMATISRGGAIALLVAILATVVAFKFAHRATGALTWISFLVLVGLALLAYVGRDQVFWDRMETIFDLRQHQASGRIPNWRDALQSVPQFWLLGSGLGSYRFTYPRFQELDAPVWFFHAENQYVEAVVDGGVVGLALMLAMITLVSYAGIGLIRGKRAPHLPLGITAVFAISSQLVHGLFDFGLYIPSNTLLFALLCGAVIGTYNRYTNGHRDQRNRACMAMQSSRVGLWKSLRGGTQSTTALRIVLACSLVMLLLSWRQMRGIAALDTAFYGINFSVESRETSPEDVQRAVTELETQLQGYPDSSIHRKYAANLNMYLYHLAAYQEMKAEFSGGQQPDVTLDQLWSLSSTISLHNRLHELYRTSNRMEFETTRRQPYVTRYLLSALDHALRCRQGCPLLADAHVIIGELCGLVAPPDRDAEHLARARRLAPGDADLLYRVGALELAARPSQACQTWNRCLQLSARHRDRILASALEELSFPQIRDLLLPRQPQLILDVAKKYYDRPDSRAEFDQLVELVIQSARATSDGTLADSETLGEAYFLQGDFENALVQWKAVLRRAPSNVDAHHRVALIYLQQQEFEKSLNHARRCARARPNNPVYRKLLEDIHAAAK